MRGRATVLAAVLLASPALASPAAAGGKDEAADLAGRLRGRVEAGVGDASAPAKVPGYAGTDPPETAHRDGSSMLEAAKRRAADPTRPEGDAGSFVKRAAGSRPDIAIKRGEAWLGAARRAEDKPEDQLGAMLSGAYEDCAATPGIAGGGGQTRYCDDYIETAERACAVGRVVVVDRRHDYRCERRRTTHARRCDYALRVEIEDGAIVETWDPVGCTDY